jgi:hypothetical protein
MAHSANLSKIQRRSDSPAHRTTRASFLGPLAAAVIGLMLSQWQIPTVIDAWRLCVRWRSIMRSIRNPGSSSAISRRVSADATRRAGRPLLGGPIAPELPPA